MFERIWEYLSRHIKIAFKSVFFNFKQYSCFFAAIFIIQLLFGMMAISATNNNSVAYDQIAEEYKYHYVIRNLTPGQYDWLKEYGKNDAGIIDKNRQTYYILTEEDGMPPIVRKNVVENKEEYDVFIRFGKLDRDTGKMQSIDKIKEYCDRFEKNYVSKLASLEVGYATPNFTTERTLLLDYESRVAANTATFAVIAVVLLALSIFLLTSIYNIRLNQYKFTYGIYMTFGADFKMLFATAFWEMFVIMLATFIPAALVSTLVVFLIYLPSGFKFAFDFTMILLLFVFSTLVVLISVIMPMFVTSKRRPMSLIVTEDNSNLVTSPRKSFNLLGKSFPGHYEMYSLWRFRKYNIQLLTSAIIFCALFICGLYLANIYTTDLNYPRTQFTIEINDEATIVDTYSASFSESIQGINAQFREDFKEELQKFDKDGEKFSETFNAITGIEPTGNATPKPGDLDEKEGPTTEARYIQSFLLVNNKDVKPFATGFIAYNREDVADKPYEGEGSYKVTNNVVYKAVDNNNRDDLLAFLSQYTIEGDVNKIFESTPEKQYVIVGDSISNISTFNFKEGDKIVAATKIGQATEVDSNLTGTNLLRAQIMCYYYKYTELEVCAVIKDIPSGSVPVYVLNHQEYNSATNQKVDVNAAYKDITGREALTTKLNVYTYDAKYGEKDVFQMTDEHITYIENALRKMISEDRRNSTGAIVVTDLNQLAENNIKEDEHYSELYVAISVLILCISPIIWFFSQILYYFKREKEFNIIQSMGANGSDIRKIYLIGGISMSVLSFIVSIVLSYLASYLMFYAYNVIVPSFSGEYVRYTFYMPWYALVIAVVMSVSCGFFSAYLPYKSYFKNRYSLENGGGGKDDE
ncbi:MAG: ABC transporter permease [Clostridia bacterium]|nr:ABC transporter permease [Clostridia bacterium]